ncbi:MAG: sensor histidine kinase [Clostridia bacterium]|nr:sensor histidine kinase [Clostridia bacterium]
MKQLLMRLRSITLRNKLIISFIGFIVVPLIVLGYFSIQLYSSEMQNTVIKSSVQSNEQVIRNLDTFLGTLIRLSEYPIKDKDVRALMVKDYKQSINPEYERYKDFDSMKYLLYNNIKTISDMIDSVLLYKAGTYEIVGRIPTDSLVMSYNPSKEEWVKRILKEEGGHAIIGVHRDYQQKAGRQYVISVGRSVINPGSKESLGFVIINVGIGELERLWMDTNLTQNSRFYLLDESDNIIFSRDQEQVSKSIHNVLGMKIDFQNASYKTYDFMGEKYYILSSKSKLSNWKAITVVPEKELFSYLGKMFYITVFITTVISILSVIMAILIATSVTKPLYKLNRKMKQIGKGNFDIEIDQSTGEVGEISITVRKMIEEIKRLINKIYCEEEEKRVAEMIALQAQINPHFLYNTLNTIKWMANMQGAASIENALNSLSAIFAFTARIKGDFITIEEEVKFIKDYLAILNLRYYNRFSVSYEIDEAVYQYKTLKFILQPVIENAVFHGIEGVERKGLIKIAIRCEEDKVYFIVEDNGKGIGKEKLFNIFEEDTEVSRSKLNSIGIPNIQKRIKLHFGEQYGISIDSVDEQGTKVTIAIPALPLQMESEGG